MNGKQGQVVFFTFMLALTLIVLALGLAFPVRETIDNIRGNTTNSNFTYVNESDVVVNGTITQLGLDCDNEAISNFDKGACIVADLTMFHFIGGLIFLAGTILAAKVLF